MYKKINKLSSVEAAYIAALVDGEGTITLTRRHANTPRHLAITLSNTDCKLLKRVSDIIGAGQITKKQPYKKGYSLSYTYQIYSKQALNLLAQISTYLQTYKRRRAELVLENYRKVTPRNGKYSEEILRKMEKFIKAFFAITSLKGREIKIGKFDTFVTV